MMIPEAKELLIKTAIFLVITLIAERSLWRVFLCLMQAQEKSQNDAEWGARLILGIFLYIGGMGIFFIIAAEIMAPR